MGFPLRFLTVLLLGPFASFLPLTDRASANPAPLAAREGLLILRAALDLEILGGMEGLLATLRLESEEGARLLFERRLTAEAFDSSGAFTLAIPAALLQGLRARAHLRILSADGRLVWTASVAQGRLVEDQETQDLGRLTLRRMMG